MLFNIIYIMRIIGCSESSDLSYINELAFPDMAANQSPLCHLDLFTNRYRGC